MVKGFCDFVVRYNPKQDSHEDIVKRILFSIIIKRLKHNKPAVTFIGADSGEGKSWSVLTLMEWLFEIQGLDPVKYIKECNVCTPLEYGEKLDNLLHNKDLKKVNLIAIHEAREIVKAKLWHSFVAQSVADINALSRSIKRLAIFIVSQFIRDITNDIRYTLNYYMTIRRPLGKKARLTINVLWKDDRDLEKPKLRKRRLAGYLVYPDGKYRRFVPKYFELRKPKPETIKIFEKMDYEAKSVIIKNKIHKLQEEMKKDVGEQSNKVRSMVEFYSKDIGNLTTIGKRYKKGFRINTQFREMHDLSRGEALEFEKILTEKIKEKGLMGD